MNHKVEQHIKRSRQRVLKMVRPEGKELYTTDPAMVEVRLAEIDAIIALTYAIQEHGQVLVASRQTPYPLPPEVWSGRKNVAPVATVPFHVHQKLDKLDSQIQSILTRLEEPSELERARSASASDVPWWAFWRHWRE